MSVVVSGAGSPVSPETNIICDIGRISGFPLTSRESGNRGSGDEGRELGGESGIGNDMIERS
jgi:hypothetical protein